MTSGLYLEQLIAYYKSTFDLESPWTFHDVEYSAYGYFYSHNEKFVLTKEAQMWETNSYEHIFFCEKEGLAPADIEAADHMIRTLAEPELVRGGDKYPPKNHMYTYLTYVFLCSSPVDPAAADAVRRYHFTRNYLFTVRGWCEARMIAVDLAENRAWGNQKAKPVLKLYRRLLDEGR